MNTSRRLYDQEVGTALTPDKCGQKMPLREHYVEGLDGSIATCLYQIRLGDCLTAVRLFSFKDGLVYPRRLGDREEAAYLGPHPTWSSRTAILVFPREIPAGPSGRVSDFVDVIHSQIIAAFSHKPVFIAWPMKDIAFGSEILETLWLQDFPNAEVMRIEDAGHYIQEDAHEKVIPPLLQFLEKFS